MDAVVGRGTSPSGEEGGRAVRHERAAPYAEVFGSASWLLSHTPAFSQFPLASLEALIAAPHQLGQIRLYRRHGRPFAVAAWAALSESVEKRVLAGGSALEPNEWGGGDRLWLIYLAAPFGGEQAVLADLHDTVFGGAPVRHLRGENVEETSEGVAALRGRPRSPYPLVVQSTFDPSVIYRKATPEDVADLAPRLRAPDVEEIRAATGLSAEQGLAASFANSPQCFSIFKENRLVAMFGVGRTSQDDVGLMWMLSSDISRHGRTLLHDSRWWLDLLGRDYRLLRNSVSLRNRTMVAWLTRIGVRFGRQVAFGPKKEPFMEFTWVHGQ